MGPDGSAGLRRLPAHGGQRRPVRLGALRLREDARLPLGHLPRRPPTAERKIHFGEHLGEPAWQDVPGEHRANLRRIIVTQGDTEPASVEQQRHLGLTCPSQYDLRNLFQVNVEEGRHLWAMVYLLHRYFGRDGREEAEALLERRSGDADNPRILGAFNEKTPDWLAFFMFTYFTDRDGKFQLCALAESGFDPLARTTKFMLTEEAHHMFVGESGMSRDPAAHVRRDERAARPTTRRSCAPPASSTCRRSSATSTSTSRVTIDLFGADQSSNAATFYGAGLKGRFEEGKRDDDHRLHGATYKVLEVADGALVERDVPMLNALNEVLRDDFIKDSVGGIDRWNKVIEKAGLPFRLAVPHKAFNRKIGTFANVRVSPDGRVVGEAEWDGARARMAADAGGPRVRRVADGPRRRAGQVRELDRAAGDGHQQAAGRLRVRAVQLACERPSRTRR